jgi:hypothetical protein
MSKQQYTASRFEDALHALARRANRGGLTIKEIGDAFAERARFVRYIPDHAEYPPVVSAETSARRRGHA